MPFRNQKFCKLWLAVETVTHYLRQYRYGLGSSWTILSMGKCISKIVFLLDLLPVLTKVLRIVMKPLTLYFCVGGVGCLRIYQCIYWVLNLPGGESFPFDRLVSEGKSNPGLASNIGVEALHQWLQLRHDLNYRQISCTKKTKLLKTAYRRCYRFQSRQC